MIKAGFSTSNMFLSRVIRWFTKAEYSHCWFLFDAYGKQWILQADIGGVQIDPFEKYAKKWSKILTVDLPEDFDIAPAWSHLAENYGYTELFGDWWVYLGRWLKMKWANPLSNTKTLVCSELMTITFQQQTNPLFDVFKQLDSSTISPQADLLNLLSALKSK